MPSGLQLITVRLDTTLPARPPLVEELVSFESVGAAECRREYI